MGMRQASGESDLPQESVGAVVGGDLWPHHLQHDPPVVFSLPGEEHNCHATAPELPDDSISSSQGPVEQAGELFAVQLWRLVSRRDRGSDRSVEDTIRPLVSIQQPFDLGQNGRIRQILLLEPERPFAGRQLERFLEQFQDPLPARSVGHVPSASTDSSARTLAASEYSSPYSQARARVQSR
jgi:hypothetical protein